MKHRIFLFLFGVCFGWLAHDGWDYFSTPPVQKNVIDSLAVNIPKPDTVRTDTIKAYAIRFTPIKFDSIK